MVNPKVSNANVWCPDFEAAKRAPGLTSFELFGI